jgi:hypothetical protein
MNLRTLKGQVPVAAFLVLWWAGAGLMLAQTTRDAVETLKTTLRSDRKTVIATEMKLTDHESEVFWPLYRSYRAEVEKVTDRVAELVLEYSDLYPNVPEEKASEMLQQYAKIEQELLSVKLKYLKKMRKVLPATKVFQFAQLDNRFDLGTRVGIASCLPILGSETSATGQAH